MNNTELFLSILKTALHGTSYPEIPTATTEDYHKLYEISQNQQAAPLIFQQIFQLDSFQKSLPEFQEHWRTDTLRQVGNQARKSFLFTMLYDKMRQHGFHPLVVKGIICRNLYPQPDLRISNDEDLLIPRSEFASFDEFLLLSGFQRNELIPEKEYQEIGYQNPSNGLYLEVHMDLFAWESGAYGHLNQLFLNAFQHPAIVHIQGTKIYTLAHQQHLLYLICHSLKHFLHSGFGIRQLCDIMVFTKCYRSEIHWSELIEILKEYHMYTFTMNLLDIGIQFLDFSWEDIGLTKPTDLVPDSLALLDDMMDGGIFGKSNLERVHSANITLNAAENDTSNVAFGVWASLFPDKEYIRTNYVYARNHKVLLPVAYVHRILSYIVKKKPPKKSATKSSTQIGMERVKLLEKYEIVEK